MSADAANKRRRVGEDTGADTVAGGGGQAFVSVEAFAEMKAEMARMKEQMNAALNGGGFVPASEMKYITKSLTEMKTQMDGINTILRDDMAHMNQRLSHLDRLEEKCESQKRKIQCLETRCDLLMRMGAMVMKNEEWEYAAPDIDAAHWVNLGFEEEAYHVRMRRFLDRIKRYAFSLRRGLFCEEKLALGEALNDGEDALIYDDALLPHWVELGDALQISEYSFNVSIKGVQLASAAMAALAPALSSNTIDSLGFHSNDFANGEGLQFAIDCMENNEALKEFHWSNNMIGSAKEAQTLVDALIGRTQMVSVTLENCFGESIDAYGMLCKLVAGNKDFTTLDISSNGIRTAGDSTIPDFLAANPPLSTLFLYDNNLEDADAILIARALKHNTNLRYLELAENDITNVGRQALLNAVFDSTSLNHVSGSNHTCKIEGLRFGRIPENAEEQMECNRWCKIFTLLSARNREGTNVQHLSSEFEGDASSKLVPRVLRRLQISWEVHDLDSFESEKPLSIMYEILRGWKMPSLYANARVTANIE